MQVLKHDICRISNSPLVDLLDLGLLPFSTFPHPSDPEIQRFPLQLVLSKTSGLVQLRHTVDPEAMYSHYWYKSGINSSMPQSLNSIVQSAMKKCVLQANDTVIDIGSNDGTLLSGYPKNIFRVGIDPAKNIQPKECDLHINTYFSYEAYSKYLNLKKAKIVTSIAMFYDVENPVQFAKDVEKILHPEGMWIIELSYLPTMLEKNSFETICLEHLEYYSLESIEFILKQTQLRVEHVELNDVNGGSFRLYIRFVDKAKETEKVQEMRKVESTFNLKETKTYLDFLKRIEKNKKEIKDFLETQKRLGKLVLGYGASTKGNTILSYYGIDSSLVSYVADRNPMKWGRQTVTRIPIISEEEARAMNPDYFLALPYHFMPEFLDREKEFIQRGGKFVVPNPHLSILPH